MTFLDAAIEILKQNNNQPMSAKEIWNRISEQNLVNSQGKTPWASLNTIMIYHSRPEYKKNIYFKIVSENPIKFCINEIDTPHIETNSQSEVYDEIQNLEKVNFLYSITSKSIGWKKLSIYNNDNNIEYRIEECEEFTYLIEDKAHATIKIGKTKNDPEVRLNQLKTANPSLTILHVFPSTQFSETDLHKKFSEFQKDLEWFFYTKGLKNFINDELQKHDKIISAYNKKIELELEENKMLSAI